MHLTKTPETSISEDSDPRKHVIDRSADTLYSARLTSREEEEHPHLNEHFEVLL